MEAMRVGLIGLGRGGQRLAQVLLKSSWCALAAVASHKGKRMEEFAELHPGVTVYDDFRSLIVESRLDALFLAVPPFKRINYLHLAAERRLPVWMMTPPGRSFDEVVKLADEFEQAGVPLVVSRSWGLEPAMQRDTIGLAQLGRFFFARGNVTVCWEEDLDWRGDSHRAGGGVLLDQGYALLDTVVQVMGLPGSVYAAGAGVSRPAGRFPYDTEDTAAVICRFDSGAIAVVSACWTAGPPGWSLDLYGTEGSLSMDGEVVRLRDRAGLKELGRYARSPDPLACQVEDFLATVRSQSARFRAAIRQHLPAMAVIQAAYLSARTGQPESPSNIFTMHNVREVSITGL